MGLRRWMIGLVAAGLCLGSAPLAAQQMTTVDPNVAIDSDLHTPPPAPVRRDDDAGAYRQDQPVTPPPSAPAAPATGGTVDQGALDARGRAEAQAGNTYEEGDLIDAAEGVFGKGAAGLAGIIEKILKEQGRPNAYIAGREAAGAIGIGLRYGSGDLFHKIEGQRKVFWTGPSIGFDLGGDATKVFVLVYNLYDTQDLYRRFPQAEGRLYFVGGFSATYLRRGDIVLIPVRLGVGWRAGVNAGYMKFSEKSRWLPF